MPLMPLALPWYLRAHAISCIKINHDPSHGEKLPHGSPRGAGLGSGVAAARFPVLLILSLPLPYYVIRCQY